MAKALYENIGFSSTGVEDEEEIAAASPESKFTPGDVSVDAYIVDESLWITQKSMAKLFGIDKSGISRHLNKIFKSGELKKEVVVAKFATTNPHGAIEGKTQENDSMYYNLDAIISVGYRVNSIKATHFRIWATKVLKEYMTKGFLCHYTKQVPLRNY